MTKNHPWGDYDFPIYSYNNRYKNKVDLSLDATHYEQNGTISVTLDFDKLNRENAVIVLVNSDIEHGRESAVHDNYEEYRYLSDFTELPFYMSTPMDQDGLFDVRVYENDDGGEELASITIAVGNATLPGGTVPKADAKVAEDESPEEQTEAPLMLSAWMKSKTGRFYSQFADGKMYMEYEMEYDGTVMTIISATKGNQTYSESKMNGQSAGVSIMDDEYMHIVDHASKTVMKMALQKNTGEIVNTMIEEGDVDPARMKSGTREIDGKTYDTEEWEIEGGKSILCFDGDSLAYMIGEYEGEETVIKVLKISDKVDESLFEIPEDYQVMSY